MHSVPMANGYISSRIRARSWNGISVNYGKSGRAMAFRTICAEGIPQTAEYHRPQAGDIMPHLHVLQHPMPGYGLLK